MSELKRTPLYGFHEKHDARCVPFAGWEMPVQYSSILEEHRAVRETAGIFDVSHMGEVRVKGKDAIRFLDKLVPGDVSAMKEGQALYTCLCYENGGVVDDLIIYKLSEENFFICVNAGNKDKDFEWFKKHVTAFDCEVTDESDDYVQIAFQGPQTWMVLETLLPEDFSTFKRFTFLQREIDGVPVIISRTGYTGEDGCEIYCPSKAGESLAGALFEAGKTHGVKLCGLGARDSLRLEAGYPLYGHEIDQNITPIQGGIGWIVKGTKAADFIGRDILEKQKREGVSQRVIYFILDDRRIAREGTPVLCEDKTVGKVVSGTLSPILNKAIGSALINTTVAEMNQLYVNLRGTHITLQPKKPPLHR